MLLLVRLIAFTLIFGFAFAQTTNTTTLLPPDEVEALRDIARRLGKTDWDFNVDPCSGQSGWVDPTAPRGSENAVTCNCSFSNNTVCHVVSIVLKAQNLAGSVPPELVRLPFLQEIDLSRNYLNGTIPREWGSMRLVNISLLANRMTGPIPGELANISTLVNLTLEYNQLSGAIPPQFGNLPRIERLLLTSNNLTGELPASLGRLTTLRDFRIGDNNFSGIIPEFIQNWTNAERIVIQGSGLAGPIPSGIGNLTRLTDLRISDLNGNASSFPPLSGMRNLRTLILRSCNIVGQLPPYIGQMTSLGAVLDLSFNRLSGPIPDTFSGLSGTDYIYLTGNSLNGPLPAWFLQDGDRIDLSYNNLTLPDSASTCQPRSLNLFASSKGNSSGIISCLRSPRCSRTYYSLHINCGGPEVADGNYGDDSNSGGPSNFVRGNPNWGFSSTGHFLDDDRPIDSYVWSNTSSIVGQNPRLYMNARRSPLSLTYYGFCLGNGNYTVNLHFAEIMFTDDRTYNSLGRRVFDVYIQGNLVLKDFNIENEAGGVNRAIIRTFTAVVTDSTLDIRFYWAGKGTNAIPYRGVYGPLVSAISVNPNFPVPSENGNALSTGAIVGIVFGVLSAILIVVGILWWMGCFKRKDTLEYELRGMDLQTGSYTYRQIKAATNNFDPANKIGEGGFGPVYNGMLPDGTAIAVKQLSSKSKQGNREFITEIGMISALQHPHLVKLFGCCIEGNQLLLIYEYLENNSLARALFGQEQHLLNLDWPTRHNICIGIARGLAYLHEESRIKIVHRDIKATNVLLDKNLSPKISDFGLAKLDEEDNTHMSTRIAGTYGYMAPEYAMRGHLTDKADVYSYGVLLLEVISGKSIMSMRAKMDNFNLLDWANSLKESGNLLELVDRRLESHYKKEEVLTTIEVALLCTNLVATERPKMSSVVSMLEGSVSVKKFITDSHISAVKLNAEETTDEETKSNHEHGHSESTDVPWTGSSISTSTSALYPPATDTDYGEEKTR